jgi:lipopolysaccharide export system permease protein
VIRKLDKLLLKAFLGPFAATFLITVMVLVMQFFWLWIDDFVGKGISTDVIVEFIVYMAASLVPLALPLAVLLSSIMTLGNLGETYELVAVKASGMSLLRFIRPLFVVVLLICGVAFLFGNYVIPVAQLKSRTLLYDIVNKQPAFDIKEGVFYNKIPDFSIKVGRKESDSIIHDVIIYERGIGAQDNFTVASDGIMRVGENKRYLQFNLKNGWRYEERSRIGEPSEFIRLGFKEYTRSFDLSALQFQRSADSLNKSNFRYLSMRQLEKVIDSVDKKNNELDQRVNREVFVQTGVGRYLDSSWKNFPPQKSGLKKFDDYIPVEVRSMVNERTANKIAALHSSFDSFLLQFQSEQKELRRHKMEWHRKISLSMACMVLFLIGAPLGSIIRKGGLGNSMISAIIFFMLFYFISNTGEKFAKEGSWSVFTGMWLSTFVLLPIGIFLFYKATHDSQLFNREFYHRLWRKVKRSYRS